MRPCWVSIVTQSWPERAASSAVQEFGIVHHAPKVASPARRWHGCVPADDQDGRRTRLGDGLHSEIRRILGDDVQLFAGALHEPAPERGNQIRDGCCRRQAHRLAPQSLDWYWVHLRQRVISSHRQAHLFTTDSQRSDAIRLDGRHQAEREVDGVALKKLQVGTRRSRHRVDLDRWEALAVLRDEGCCSRYVACRLVSKDRKSNGSREVGPQVPQRLIFGLDQPPRMWQQHGAGRSQPHPPGISLEQLKPELTLQRLDPLCERRLGQMQVLRGMSEMAGVGDFYESPELTQFHACSRLWADTCAPLKL